MSISSFEETKKEDELDITAKKQRKMITMDELEKEFLSFGINEKSINTIKHIHQQVLSSQGCGSSDDPFNLTSLVDSLESNPFELSELMAACNEIKEKAELNGTTPILEQILSLYEEAYNGDGETTKLSMTFMNKLKAKKRRKRLNQKKEKQQLRGSNYSDKMKAKLDRKKQEKIKQRRWTDSKEKINLINL